MDVVRREVLKLYTQNRKRKSFMVRLSIQNLNRAFYLCGLFSIPDAAPQTTVPGLHSSYFDCVLVYDLL